MSANTNANIFTINDLNRAWCNYNAFFAKNKNQRFGQYLYINYDVDVNNSYYMENDSDVYTMLLKHISQISHQ